jgi:hypothetical protein
MSDPVDFYFAVIGLSALGLVILFMTIKLTILYCRGYREPDYERM